MTRTAAQTVRNQRLPEIRRPSLTLWIAERCWPRPSAYVSTRKRPGQGIFVSFLLLHTVPSTVVLLEGPEPQCPIPDVHISPQRSARFMGS